MGNGLRFLTYLLWGRSYDPPSPLFLPMLFSLSFCVGGVCDIGVVGVVNLQVSVFLL